MLTSEEKRKWIIENCYDPIENRINLKWLDFSGYEIDLSHMKAEEIRQSNQKANVIYQSEHKAELISQNRHSANVIYQSEHKAELISQNRHSANVIYQSEHKAELISQNRHKAEIISQEHNYAKKLYTTDLKNYKKKTNVFNKIYYELKEKK